MLKRFCVTVEVGNLYVELAEDNNNSNCTDGYQRLGFFATRCVKGRSDKDAVQKVIEIVKNEMENTNIVRNPENSLPYIFVDSVDRIDFWKSLKIPKKGFNLFPHTPDIEKPSNAIDLNIKYLSDPQYNKRGR